jgi:polysaccharide transporter, PST family
VTASAPPDPAAAAGSAASHGGLGSLRSLVVSGIRWKLGSQIIVQGLSFASTLTLARLLSPRDFGLAGIALAFASLAFLLADLGLGASLVQRSELTEDDRSTAFWTSAGLGCLLAGAGVGLSWPLADLYDQPRVQPLFAVLSLSFVLTALGTTQGALLIRGLRFRSLELRTLAATSTSLAAGIVLAALGYGPWAIITQALLNCGVSTALLWRSSAWRPQRRYSTQSLRHLLGYGGPLFGSSLVWYVERNLDNVLIGRFRGPAALGQYGLAYNIMLVPLKKVVQPVQQVFFPALSRVRERSDAAAIWLRMTRLLAVFAVPSLAGLAIVAPDFVVVVLGEKWRPAVHVLQILSWVGLIQLAAAQTTTMLQVLGRSGDVFRYAVASASLSVAGFAIGLHWGIVGVAAGYAIANTIVIPVYVALGARAVGFSLRDIARALAGVVEVAAVMAAAVLGVRLALLHHLSASPRLLVLIAVGVAVYVPLCRWRVPDILQEARRALTSRAPPESERPDPVG